MSLPADRRLERIIEQREFSGVFFLHGEAAVDPATRDFNLDVFRGSDVTPEALASALAMPPVMSPRRVILLFDADRLTPTGRKVVEETVGKLPADVTFVVAAKIPDRSKAAFYRKLKSAGIELEWKSPREGEIPGWLIERARDRFGAELAANAAAALADAVGADLGVLEAELEKLAGAADGAIDLALVKALVPNTRDVNRWEWIDEVASRDYARARRRLPDLLATPSESAVGLLVALIEQHLLVGVAIEGGAGLVGQTLDQAGKAYMKWKARTIAGQARAWTVAELDDALVVLLEADRRAKTGASDREALEELLLRLEVGRRAGHRLRATA